ncbi:MAG: sensor histidine kinase [Cyanobium sp.]|jgi:two-component system osmolarity sensor histidine kinase EnvZ|nr:HAMP domain-containing sensor histidine kinase [Synechococcaceae cyanobacterium]
MVPPEYNRLSGQDWLALLLCCLAGVGGSACVLWLLLTTVLMPVLLQERGLRTNRNVRLVEKVLETTPTSQLPHGVVIDRSPAGPETADDDLLRFDPEFITFLNQRYGLRREFRRDRPPLNDPWGGLWIRLNTPHDRAPPIWLYQPERLASNVWYLPLLRSLAVVLGLAAGSMLFLRQRLEQPLGRMLEQLQTTPQPPLQLLPEQGVTPLRALTFRINRLLESVNDAHRARSTLLRGVAHDLASPQTRIMLHAESLRDSLQGEALEHVEAIENDLRQLQAITEQLGRLAEASLPRRQRTAVGLDDLCARVAGSYPAVAIRLQVPRLLVVVESLGLERCLGNLIDNAIEYGQPPIQVTAERQRSRLLLRVEDHGPGLASPTQLTMTTPPMAADRQRSRHQGLGLQIVDRFCRDHGGRLLLQPSPLGGLCATMRLESLPEAPLFI